jgi:hypothetical protein
MDIREFADPKGISTKEISDGYHTFKELYEHRRILFSVICHSNRMLSWKSWRHSDGAMFDNSFIVGINTPEGQYTYHYNSKHWDEFDVEELPNAPEYDGHKPKVITRLLSLFSIRKEAK